MGVYVHDNNWASRRMIAFVAMVLFHILLIWGLKSGFAVKLIDTLTAPIEATVIEEVVKDDAPPPPPPPRMELPPVEVPPPVVDITIPIEATTTALSNVTDKPPPAPPPPVAAAVVRTALKPNPRASQPNVDEYYPPTSTRLGEEGIAKVKVCVGTNGRVIDATLEESSGFERLDQAAIKVAKLYRFNPATENGKPVEACAPMPLRFQIKDK
jgi:periplasmic protein TonB